MARAETRTLLPLDRWARILGIDPRHFNQVTTTALVVRVCSTVWKQWAWQESHQVGREDVAIAIELAETIMGRYLHYSLLPKWHVDDRLPTIQPGIMELLNANAISARGFRQAVRLDPGHFIEGGIEAKTLIEASVTVTYSDPDGDGYDELATISFATTVTDEEEIAIYFAGENAQDQWEIRPLRTVSIAAGVATVTMDRHQLVDPDLWEALSPSAVDGEDNTKFVSTVDAYRHHNDPQQQATLIWNPRPDTCDCGGTTCAACQFSTQTACLRSDDLRHSIVAFQPATWDATDEEFDTADYAVARAPDRLRLWYRAGLRDQSRNWPSLQMASDWERAVVYFSLALLDRPLCGCNNIDAVTRHWATPLNMNLERATFQLGQRVLDNPFGATRGALYAWDRVNADGARIGQAVRV